MGSDTNFLVNKIDSLYKVISSIIITLCCGAIAWGAAEIISLGKENMDLKGRLATQEMVQSKDKVESDRHFTEVDKRVDKMETQLNRRLENIESKIDRLLSKTP